MAKDYKGIMYLKRPKSNYPPMPIKDRAAQFAPFAALSGHYEAICETHRYVKEEIELADSYKEDIKDKLDQFITNLSVNPICKITYFQKDEKKEGGHYISVTPTIKKYDEYKNIFITTEGLVIYIDNIVEFDF